jgi:hypothetical protein
MLSLFLMRKRLGVVASTSCTQMWFCVVPVPETTTIPYLVIPAVDAILLPDAVIDKTASAEAPPSSSWFEHGHSPPFSLPSDASDSECHSPQLPLWLRPTIRKWTELARRNVDDSIARQPLVTSANRVRSSATVRGLARIARVKIRATRARFQARNHAVRRALRTHQQTATMMLVRRYRQLGRDDTQILSRLYAPRRMLTTLGLRPRLH